MLSLVLFIVRTIITREPATCLMKRKQKDCIPHKPRTIDTFHSIVEKRVPSLAERQVSDVLSATASRKLSILGCRTSTNAMSNNGAVWIGPGDAYTNTFTNNAGEHLILVIWGPDASWVNADHPLVTMDLPASSSQLISFASGAVGAWSSIYPDTVMSNGQISNTCGEYTMSPDGVIDVSREVNMNDHGMSIVVP